MSAFSERVEREDEKDRLNAMAALLLTRAAQAKRNVQMEIEYDDGLVIGTCGQCGAYHDQRYVATCHCGGYVG